jgi:hypothetical protein
MFSTILHLLPHRTRGLRCMLAVSIRMLNVDNAFELLQLRSHCLAPRWYPGCRQYLQATFEATDLQTLTCVSATEVMSTDQSGANETTETNTNRACALTTLRYQRICWLCAQASTSLLR